MDFDIIQYNIHFCFDCNTSEQTYFLCFNCSCLVCLNCVYLHSKHEFITFDKLLILFSNFNISDSCISNEIKNFNINNIKHKINFITNNFSLNNNLLSFTSNNSIINKSVNLLINTLKYFTHNNNLDNKNVELVEYNKILKIHEHDFKFENLFFNSNNILCSNLTNNLNYLKNFGFDLVKYDDFFLFNDNSVILFIDNKIFYIFFKNMNFHIYNICISIKNKPFKIFNLCSFNNMPIFLFTFEKSNIILIYDLFSHKEFIIDVLEKFNDIQYIIFDNYFNIFLHDKNLIHGIKISISRKIENNDCFNIINWTLEKTINLFNNYDKIIPYNNNFICFSYFNFNFDVFLSIVVLNNLGKLNFSFVDYSINFNFFNNVLIKNNNLFILDKNNNVHL